jgi:hypothetical protein
MSADRSLFEPNEQHVLAALIDNDAPFAPPVSQLLELGEARRDDQDERIAALGLGQEHVPDLVRLALDRRLYEAEGDDEIDAELWGPVNAVLALKPLDATGYEPQLVAAFDLDSELLREELPAILGKVGEAAIAPLRAYLRDQSRWIFGRAAAGSGLVEVAQQHPGLRGQAVQALSDALEQFATNDEELNGFLVTDLASELQAVEALPLIRRAFEADRVDESIMGDWLDVLEAVGEEPDPDDPLVALSNQRRRTAPQRRMGIPPFGLTAPGPARSPGRKGDAARKRKNKRKTESASRRANKKKRKKNR